MSVTQKVRSSCESVLHDVERVADGGAACRFVIGEYGSGKTFFLHLIRSIALEKRLVTVHADLSPDRRLHAASGQARGLYAELMHNVATRARRGTRMRSRATMRCWCWDSP